MNPFLDYLLVTLLLLTALVYAVWSLGPKLLRARLLLSLGRAFERGASIPGLGALGRRFLSAAERKQPGCGGCDGCAPALPVGQASNAEILIPVGKIGRRA